MVSTKGYRLEDRGGILLVVTKDTSYCPVCGHGLIRRGNRERRVVSSDGQKIRLVIRRLYCFVCKRIHHELPDCIVPYKRHCSETIEEIAKGGGDKVPCEDRTIRRIKRWWKNVQPYFMNIIKALNEKYKLELNNPPVFKGIIRAIVNSNNWIFSG